LRPPELELARFVSQMSKQPLHRKSDPVGAGLMDPSHEPRMS